MAFYSPSNQASQYTLYGATSTSKKTIQTAAADETLGTITLPAALFGTVKAAFIDIDFLMHNQAAAAQYFDGAQNIEASDGGTTIVCYAVQAAENTMIATEAFRRVTLRGRIDVSSIAVAGATITCVLKSAKSKASDLDLYDVRIGIRFITG